MVKKTVLILTIFFPARIFCMKEHEEKLSQKFKEPKPQCPFYSYVKHNLRIETNTVPKRKMINWQFRFNDLDTNMQNQILGIASNFLIALKNEDTKALYDLYIKEKDKGDILMHMFHVKVNWNSYSGRIYDLVSKTIYRNWPNNFSKFLDLRFCTYVNAHIDNNKTITD